MPERPSPGPFSLIGRRGIKVKEDFFARPREALRRLRGSGATSIPLSRALCKSGERRLKFVHQIAGNSVRLAEAASQHAVSVELTSASITATLAKETAAKMTLRM